MVRWGELMAGSFLLLSLMACSPSEKLTNTEIQGQWLYDDHCAECHENPHPELRKQPPNLHGLFLAKTLPSGAPATDEQVRKRSSKVVARCRPSTSVYVKPMPGN